MPNVLVIGANRGLGLEFARQYRADGWDVIGTARDPESAEALRAIGAAVVTLDVSDPGSIDRFMTEIGDRPIDLLIVNAGIMGQRQGMDRADWARCFAINAVAPTDLAMRLKNNVMAGQAKTMVALSSKLGSMAANDSGGVIAYRSSKAALNAAWTTLAVDWRADGLVLALLHPGWAQTDMGGPNATIDPATSIAGLRAVIAGLRQQDSGCFVDFRGEQLKW